MAQTTCELDGRSLTVAEVVRVARDADVRVTVAPAAREALRGSRRLVEAAIASGQTVYGINTGFGKLANVRVAPDKLDQLQANLIRSHAAGVGTPLSATVVRGLMLLCVNVDLRPTSGVRPELVDALVALLNAGIVPRVPEQGSVGASGDLAPLSHVALVLMGEGEVLDASGAARPEPALGRAGLPVHLGVEDGDGAAALDLQRAGLGAQVDGIAAAAGRLAADRAIAAHVRVRRVRIDREPDGTTMARAFELHRVSFGGCNHQR